MVKKTKKRKKAKLRRGFTLIEILAAVTILGILSIVAIVSVNNIIQKAKQNHYTTAEENLEMAGQSYAQQNRNVLPKAIGQKKKISLKTLVDKNYIEPVKDYNENDCDLEESYVQVFKYSKEDYSYIAYLDCPVYNSKEQLEKTAPIVIVTLTNPQNTKTAKADIKITSQEKLLSWSYIVYKDGKEVLNSGSIMLQNYDKKVNKNLKLGKYTPGELKVVVTATNIYGQTTKTTSQIVEYKDETAPECIIKEVDKETNPKPWTQEPKTITVGCDDGEGSGCTREEYTKTFKTTTDVGKITIEDESGNKTTCKVSVNVDTTPPECTVELAGTSGDNGWYKNKNVTVSLKRTDAHSGVATYDLTTSTTASYDGKITASQSDTADIIWYGYIKDNVGNINKCDSGHFKVDTKQPACTISRTGTSGNNGWYKTSPVTLTLNPTDNLSGIQQTGLSTSTNPTLGSTKTGTQSDTANITWYGKVKDNAGNISDVCNSGAFKVDTTNPNCTVTFSGTSGINGWYVSNATVKINPTDALSGVDQIGLSISTSTTYNNTSTATQTNTAGQRWNGYVMDSAGNTNSCYNSVKVDTTPPTCTVSISGTTGNNGWYKENSVTVTLNPYDGLSGVGQTGLSSNATPPLGSTTSSTQGDTSGVTWYGRVQDAAGNISSTCNSGSFKVDTTKPSISWDTSEGPHNNSSGITVYTSCTDSLSGVASHTRSSSVGSPTTGTTKTHSCTDNAGNSTSTSRTFKVKTYGRHSSCGVELYKSCAHSECGIEAYNECEDSTCGIKSYKTCAKAVCGNETCRTAACGEECKTSSQVTSYSKCGGWTGSWGSYSTTCGLTPVQSTVTDSYQTSCVFHATSVLCYGGSGSSCRRMDAKTCTICTENQYKSCAHKDCGYKECETASCGVKNYKTCAAPNCGVKTYKTCRTAGCGIERYKECWHY